MKLKVAALLAILTALYLDYGWLDLMQDLLREAMAHCVDTTMENIYPAVMTSWACLLTQCLFIAIRDIGTLLTPASMCED